MTPGIKNLIGATLAGAGLFLVLGLAYPKFQIISNYRATLAQHQDALEQKKNIIDKISKMSEEYERRKGDIGRLATIVPKEKNAQEVISTMSTLAQNSGLQLKGLKTAVIDSQFTNDGLNRMIAEVSLTGSYPSFFTFLEGIEKNLRVIDLKEAAIREDAGSQLNIQIKAETYFIQ